MPIPDTNSNTDLIPDLFEKSVTAQEADPCNVAEAGRSDQVTASDPDIDADELEEPGGLRDVEGFPDNWQGPGVGGDELDDVVREAEFFPANDEPSTMEPPRDGAAPARPSAIARMAEPVQFFSLWMHALGDPERVAPSVVEARAAEIRAMGQLRACRGRLLDGGQIEVVSGMLDYLAVRHIAEGGGKPWTLLVDVEPMTDQQAFKVAHAEAAEGVPLAPLDRARFVQIAIREAFKTQRAMAQKLGIHESNLTRLLAVARCADIVAGVVTDQWTISRAQADRFMRLHGDAELRKSLLEFVKNAEPQSARRLFAAIFATFDPPPATKPGEVLVADDQGEPLGRVGRKATGEVILRLDKAAGAIELPTLIRFVEHALGQLRNSAA